MKVTQTKTRAQILDFITGAATADSEEDAVKGLKAIMEPVNSRSEMGEIFQENLGYNPITCYDVADIDAIIGEIVQDSSNGLVAKLVTSKREELVSRAMELYEAGREEQMQMCIVKAASEMFGASDAEKIANAMGVDISEVDVPSGDDDDSEAFEDPDVMGYRSTNPDDDDDLLFGDDDDDD